MQSGHWQADRWVSADGDQSADIEVYIPTAISAQAVTSSDLQAEASAERALHALREQSALESLAAILLRSEGIASSRIEGEVASTRRVFEAEYAPEDISDRPAERIVNSIRVMDHVISTAADGATAPEFDRWHEMLFDRVPVGFEPGAIRATQNWIGTRSDTPVGAEFIPPPPALVAEALDDLAGFVNRLDVAPLTQAAVAHAQFETIHPYPDGNGRVGRSLVYRSWAYRGLTGSINPPISKVLVDNRAAYIDGLMAYREGNLGAWLTFFFDVVEASCAYTHQLAARLASLQEEWIERLAGSHEDSLVRRLVGDIAARPIVSVSDVTARHDVEERGARRALEDLVAREILSAPSLRRAKRGRPGKVYEASELFTLLDLSPQDLA